MYWICYRSKTAEPLQHTAGGFRTVHKLLVGRDPIQGKDLASQPTLSRFENSRDRKQLFRLSEALADCVIERHRRRLQGRTRRITIDLDPPDDPTHAAQQLTFFNAATTTPAAISRWWFLPDFSDNAYSTLVHPR